MDKEDLIEQLTSDIFGELGFTNGWKIDDDEYERLCNKLSSEIVSLVRHHYRDKAHARFMKCKGEVRRVGVQIVEDVFDE